MPSPRIERIGRFTAILDFVMNGRSETICVGKTPLPLKEFKIKKRINNVIIVFFYRSTMSITFYFPSWSGC